MAHDGTPERDDSGVRVPPPLFYLLAFLVGLLVHWRVPGGLLPGALRWPLGIAVTIAGLLLIVWAVRTMQRVGTSVEPWKPTTAVVTTGPYRFSRNPIYVGYAVGYIGIAILVKSMWPLALLPFALQAVWWWVVRKEEAYLERKFGEEYRAYRRRVRRWM